MDALQVFPVSTQAGDHDRQKPILASTMTDLCIHTQLSRDISYYLMHNRYGTTVCSV
jgi:hypothetical protein